VVIVVLAVWLSTGPNGPLLAAIVAGLTILVAALVAAGPEGLGLGVLGACFFMSPYFRAFPIVPGTAISAVDPMLLAGIFLLFPRVTRGHAKVSSLYLGSAISVVLIGIAAALASDERGATLLEVSQWAFLILVVPLAMIALDLSNREISWFAIIYIVGQMLSSAVALVDGPDPVNSRYQGLAQHPNYFADGAMMSAALLLYLYHRPGAKTALMRSTWWLVMAICLIDIYVSGCRGAALGMAAVFVLVPFVERAAVPSFLAAFALALVAAFAQPILQRSSDTSALGRLTGSGTGQATSNFRLSEWSDAVTRVTHSPFLGSGLSLDVLGFHNNYLEVAAGIGLFGFAAYLVLLWSLTRGLFGPSVERRLVYPMVAFAVFGLTEPGFKDRSNWLPMLLSIAVFHGFSTAARHRSSDETTKPGPTDRARPADVLGATTRETALT